MYDACRRFVHLTKGEGRCVQLFGQRGAHRRYKCAVYVVRLRRRTVVVFDKHGHHRC